MKESIKFKNVTIFITGANGESFEYHKNNDYKNRKKEDIINIFKLEPFYMATELDEIDTTFKSFNTCNWAAPLTLCGVMGEDIYDSIGIVNIHLGGDVRGNYSEPYICEEMDALLSQNTFLDIELTNGEIYTFNCDDGEAYFNFDTFDPYYIDFDKKLTPEQLEELETKNEY